MAIISFLHISDFHVSDNEDEYFDNNEIFKELINDIELWRTNNNQSIDIIFITGDIAYSGLMKEYEKAIDRINPIIEKCGCSKSNVYIIPGNHDVDLNKISQEEKELITEDLLGKIDINHEIIKNASSKYILDKFSYYIDFVEKINPEIQWKKTKYGTLKPWYSKCIEVKGIPIRITGLTSVLLTDKKIQGIGNNVYTIITQLKDALKEHDDKEFSIVLSDHPFDTLRYKEKNEVDNILGKYGMLHLYGHTHINKNIKEVTTNAVQYISLSSGCLYSNNDQNIGKYNIFQIRL